MTREQEDIDELRRRISEVDSLILEAVAKRMQLSAEIGEVKAARGLDIEVKDVEKQVLSRARARARELGIDEHVTVQLFQLLVEHSKEEQRRRMDHAKDSDPGS